jgi:isoquinoline 1-oxidoreductase subunit beta
MAAELSRREFMIGAAGLTFSFALGTSRVRAALLGSNVAGKSLSPWVSIARDGTIAIMSPAAEMGQGSETSLPLILAEELDADWGMVRIVPAPTIEKFYGNPGFFGELKTARSNAVTSYFNELRIFGAQVRRVLIENAATQWGVSPLELTTEPSVVVHVATGRRMTYGKIASFGEVPATAPQIRPQDLKKPADFRLIGKDVMRVDLPLKVNGSAQYSIDVQVPNMLYGAVVRTPVEGGTVQTIDDSKIRALPGVVRIVPLAYGVGVVAQTPSAAFAAKEKLARSITWKHTGGGWQPGGGWDFNDAVAIEAWARDAADLNAPATLWWSQGDARAALAGARTLLQASYRCDYAYHAQIEPLNCVASVAPGGASAEIWAGTQSQTLAIESAANDLGIPRDNVKLNYFFMGGAYGRRGHRVQEFITDALLLSRAVERPVKVMWTRADDLKNGRMRPMTAHFLRAGLDSAGKIVAWHTRLAGDRVAPFFDPVLYKALHNRDDLLMDGVELPTYDIPNQLDEQLYRDTGMRTSPLRGIGFTANKFVTEAFLDEIAAKRGIDPVALRLELLQKTPRARAVVERVAEMAQWQRPRAGTGLGVAFIEYQGSLLAGVAEVSVDRSTGKITVHDFWCAIDCGFAVQPDNVVAQCEGSIVYGLGMALTERISYTNGAVDQSNFNDYIVPRMSDVPEMHIEIVRNDAHPTGVGQMATPLVAPAISNAVAQLTGVRLRVTPMTPERVKKALR